jgi:hypothetical protein
VSQLFSQPEYVHLLFNPALTHALPLAAAALLFSFVFRRPGVRALALGLVFVTATAVWPTVHYGESGYDRMISASDQRGGEWLDVHRHRAESGEWLFYVTAAVALAALLAPLRWPRSAPPLAALALALSLAACAMAIYIAYPAGKIRHREFRHGPPPAAELEAARTDQ